LRDPQDAGVRQFESAYRQSVDFYAWLQWLADEQLGQVQQLARELGMPLGLYGDYAVGVNPSGSETWSDQKVYRMGAGVGAPPDALALKGQDWGIPPQDPHALIAERYRPFRDLIAANMRHFGALRLDHVMALFRQWWVPVGLGATEGGYVHYPLDDLMSVLALESAQRRCLVVGEDLGTVPDEMRHAMADGAVYSYKVLLFEKHKDGHFRRPEEYVHRAIATVTTHDLPTLRGYWEGRDLELRDRLSLFPGEEIRRYVLDERVRDRAGLLAALDAVGLRPADCAGPEAEYGESLARAIHLYLAKSAAALVVLQVEDLMGMADPVNVPGTSHEHENWQRKVTESLNTRSGASPSGACSVTSSRRGPLRACRPGPRRAVQARQGRRLPRRPEPAMGHSAGAVARRILHRRRERPAPQPCSLRRAPGLDLCHQGTARARREPRVRDAALAAGTRPAGRRARGAGDRPAGARGRR
jgi:4-alpha-glucanotransferase